jgi:hypothetical protein
VRRAAALRSACALLLFGYQQTQTTHEGVATQHGKQMRKKMETELMESEMN